ncbi:MAG: ABC transporter permease [Planctomycetota bacterium]
MAPSAPQLELFQLPGSLDRRSVLEVSDRMQQILGGGQKEILLDLTHIESFDSAGMALILDTLQRAEQEGSRVHLMGLTDSLYDFFSLLSVERLLESEPEPLRPSLLERIGARVSPMIDSCVQGLGLFARTLCMIVTGPFRGEKSRLGMMVGEMYLAGNGGVSIVTLISFLLGLILAMQAWVQLRLFGAEIFIADMVSVSVTREIGPLMTAILVAARSGSAIAAQLGTMVINEEVAALRQMGIHPISYLVMPKLLGLAIVTPCLCALFCFVALVGGLLFGCLLVGLEWGAYLEETHKALKLGDVVSSALKSVSFGVVIASVSCTLGLGVRGGPEGVGLATTRSVVASIFLIIVVDAIFVLLLRVGT